jgi:hypothetical protein
MVLFCLTLVVAGCSGSGSTERFVPKSDNARKALVAALDGWQAGHPVGAVPGASAPAVTLVDTKRPRGQKLASYEIVKEESDQQGHRVFTVRLTFGQGAPQEVRFYVFGIDPLWVYREDDYNRLAGTGM